MAQKQDFGQLIQDYNKFLYKKRSQTNYIKQLNLYPYIIKLLKVVMKMRNKTQNTYLLNQQQELNQKTDNINKSKLKTQIKISQNQQKQKYCQTQKNYLQQKAKNPFNILISKTNQGISFPKAKRAITQRIDLDWKPSPNQYHYQSCQNKKRSPKFSFSKEKKFYKTMKQEKIKNQIPGPGKYQTKNLQKVLGDVIGTQARMNKQLNINNPGVGLYHIQKIDSLKKNGQTFQKSERSHLQKIANVPGPNKYNLTQKLDLKKFRQTFNRSKRLSQILSDAPGIGSYKIQNYSKRHSVSVRFTTSPRESKRQKQINPGPGNYQIPPVIKFKTKSKMQSAIFGSEDRQQKISLGPGPGSYNIEHNSKKKGVSLTGRNFYQYIQKVPSPNNYSPDFTKISPRIETVRIGKQKKIKQSQKLIPGPSDYQPQKSQKILLRHSGFVFPKSARETFQKR